MKINMKRNKGFTMIEMLIVIAVLGILAAALLATIDPFEQMKKARDTTLRNSVIDYLDAVTRYYAVKGEMPWHGVGLAAGCAVPNISTLDGAAMEICTGLLEDTGELKTGFSEALGGNKTKIKVTGKAVDDLTDPAYMVLCFPPDSKSIRQDPNTKCDDDASDYCDNAAATCHWCTDTTNCVAAGP